MIKLLFKKIKKKLRTIEDQIVQKLKDNAGASTKIYWFL